MRYSDQSKTDPTTYAPQLSNREFFAEIAKTCPAEQGAGAVLLIGANDERSQYIRRAQAPLRYDRRSSYFSHAALIARWVPEDPGRSVGVEVTLDPQDSALQVPERNGATPFRLDRYFDAKRYPNVALVALQLQAAPDLDQSGNKTERSSAERKRALVKAACTPNLQRDVYPLWDGLATWSKYTYSVERSPNPLLESVPLPAAAFCEYAYATIGIDITPGAATNHTCPELLWATFVRWQESLEAQVASYETHLIVRDPQGISQLPLSLEIEL
ncbi:MAG: hypothetical protein RL701_6535 [Pseudomonadota bacterium]